MPSDHTTGDAPGPVRSRVTAMVVLGGIAAALMGFEYQFRHLEAYTAGLDLGLRQALPLHRDTRRGVDGGIEGHGAQ